MGDFVSGQNGRSRHFKKKMCGFQTYNGQKNHIISAPKPRWQPRPLQKMPLPSAQKSNDTQSIAYFKSTPVVQPKSCVSRPIMGSCCEKCTPASKKSLVDEQTEYQGLWNVLQVPERNPDRSLWSRAFCHLLHVYKVPAHTDFTVASVDKILCNPNVVSAIACTVDNEQASKAARTSAIVAKQQKHIKTLVRNQQTTMSTVILRVTAWLLYKTLPCLLTSVQVHKGKLEYIKRASASPHPLLFLPVHYSHLDYFLLQLILYDAGVRVPYIAAGDNLNIPFVGWFLRRVGAFFIRRKLKAECDESKELLYRVVLQAYMHELLLHNENIGFFIEGGRSRSGKPQLPKVGLLKIIMEAYKKGLIEDALVVPVGIGYEKIIDGGFVDELLGKPKVMETTWRTFKALVKAFCGSYGNVRIDFAQPFSLKEYASSFVSDAEGALLTHLSRHVVYDASGCSAIMCTQLVAFLLLNKFRHGCSMNQLLDAFRWIKQECISRGVDVGFSGDDQHVLSYALKTLSHLIVYKKDSDGMKHIHPRLEKALALQYYSNAVLRIFIVDAVLATCLLAISYCDVVSEEVLLSYANVCTMCESLCELLEEEFIFCRPCCQLNHAIVVAIDRFVSQEVCTLQGVSQRKVLSLDVEDELESSPTYHLMLNRTKEKIDLVRVFSSALAPLITSYFHTIAKLTALVDNQIIEKEFVRVVQNDIRQRDLPYGECLSVEPIQNAVSLLKHKGVVESVSQDSIELLYLTEEYDDYDKIAEILAHCAQFIVT